jgi:hypothetical protein
MELELHNVAIVALAALCASGIALGISIACLYFYSKSHND